MPSPQTVGGISLPRKADYRLRPTECQSGPRKRHSGSYIIRLTPPLRSVRLKRIGLARRLSRAGIRPAEVSIVMGLGFQELFLILIIIVVLFGASRLPQLGRGLGEGISNFKRGLKSVNEDDHKLEDGKDEATQAK